MFTLTRTKYLEALESVEAMQTAMETEMENLGISCGVLSNNWFGKQADNNFSMMNTSLSSGNHAKAYAYTKGMAQVMGDYLPEIEKMMAKREQIGKQLHQDEYYEPDLSTFSEEKLIINYEYIDDVKADAEGAVSYAEKAVEILEEMIETVEEAASDYVDLSKVKELLEEGKKEIKRIENYRDEFADFGNKMSDLEYNMSYDLAVIMLEQGDTAALNNPVVMAQLNLIERTSQMESEDLEAMLKERGLTMEQYTSALLDCCMYLDFFDDDEENDYFYSYISGRITEGMTIKELLEMLGEYELYTEGSEDGKSTRHIFYQILQDAIELNPELGNYELSLMSRKLKESETGMQYNEGTNGIVFTNPVTNTIYVAYRGTSMGEWGDDGERFNCLNVNDLTPQMEQTINFFNYAAETMGWTEDMEIYVTGHSQGGNDAQISILLSEYGKYVDACYSFDGEGHSPELLDDVKKVLGEKEYNARVGRMYSICGEYDFVNHLGEKVIPEKNTIYIKCNIEDFAKMHDIVSMFCDENMNYNGMINTGIGTGPSPVTIYTAKVWEEMYEIPPKARASCQAAIMNLAEGLLSEGECWKGLNGEQATIGDALVFGLYGFGVILDAGNDTVGHYINELIMSNAKKVTRLAEKLGLPEEYAQNFYKGMCAIEDFMVNVEETISDFTQEVTYVKKQIQQEMIYYVEKRCTEFVDAVEKASIVFAETMKDEIVRKLVLPPILPIKPFAPFLLKGLD